MTSFAPEEFAPKEFFGGGGKFVTMNTRPKIPRMSISTALWTRSLTNAIILNIKNSRWRSFYVFTAVIILPWTPKICLECLLCFSQSEASSLHYRNHRQRTVSYRSLNKLFSFCSRITCRLIRNSKYRCSPISVLRTASSASFDFKKKNFRNQHDTTMTSFPCNDKNSRRNSTSMERLINRAK